MCAEEECDLLGETTGVSFGDNGILWVGCLGVERRVVQSIRMG